MGWIPIPDRSDDYMSGDDTDYKKSRFDISAVKKS